MSMRVLLPAFLLATACTRLEQIGRPPDFSTPWEGAEVHAMMSRPLPARLETAAPTAGASLWSGGRASLLGDRRAERQGDILTVVIEIDDSAEISNSTARSRSGTETMGVSALFGIPERLNGRLPEGASLDPAVETDSSSASAGDGSVKRNEQLELRIAATVVGTLPNGILQIAGRQEVRVNFEMRELLVTGYVRPEDITRQNEITYDKIASARISYGGRGQITDVQQPRWGQQLADIVLPF